MRLPSISHWLIACLFAFVAACSPATDEPVEQPLDNPATETKTTTSAPAQDPPNLHPDALVITEKAGIILTYSDEEIEKMRKDNDEDAFAEIASDITHYEAEAADFLKKSGIKVIRTDKEEVICQNSEGAKVSFKRKELGKDLILFDPAKSPIATFQTDAEQQIEKYFGK